MHALLANAAGRRLHADPGISRDRASPEAEEDAQGARRKRDNSQAIQGVPCPLSFADTRTLATSLPWVRASSHPGDCKPAVQVPSAGRGQSVCSLHSVAAILGAPSASITGSGPGPRPVLVNCAALLLEASARV